MEPGDGSAIPARRSREASADPLALVKIEAIPYQLQRRLARISSLQQPAQVLDAGLQGWPLGFRKQGCVLRMGATVASRAANWRTQVALGGGFVKSANPQQRPRNAAWPRFLETTSHRGAAAGSNGSSRLTATRERGKFGFRKICSLNSLDPASASHLNHQSTA